MAKNIIPLRPVAIIGTPTAAVSQVIEAMREQNLFSFTVHDYMVTHSCDWQTAFAEIEKNLKTGALRQHEGRYFR